MKRGVDLRSFSALKDLEAALGRFAGKAQESLDSAEREVRQAVEELDNHRRLVEHRLRRLQKACEHGGNEKDSRFAVRKMEEAEEALRRIYFLQKQLTDRQQAYRHQADKLRELAAGETVKARHYLTTKLEQLQTYTATQFSGTSSSLNTTAGTASGSTLAAGGTETAAGESLTDFKLPDGYRWVSLGEINLDEIPEDLSFQKTSSDEMKDGFSILQKDVLPALREDPSRDSGYFGERDREAGKDYQNGHQRVYDAFFGHDHIRLERWQGDDVYSITNGRHRIAVARELGWSVIPAGTADVVRKG
ncbi:hypothetical protein [Dethiobacter alkaliphilus]|uniref:hypothetical protein n=1 Tax=Dethiobacter alkaliphilus TaxID=427926 RepID=UPI002227AC5D|nr:hypothetical protein [Dethiobacter alkaliphilus]MCW3488671.1 hypothetical protein [Dethiobacter alkaliphilus]